MLSAIVAVNGSHLQRNASKRSIQVLANYLSCNPLSHWSSWTFFALTFTSLHRENERSFSLGVRTFMFFYEWKVPSGIYVNVNVHEKKCEFLNKTLSVHTWIDKKRIKNANQNKKMKLCFYQRKIFLNALMIYSVR